jgi:hypothetical protein
MLESSRRSVGKVTYAPIQSSEEDRDSGAIFRRTRGLERAAFVRGLRITPAEVAELRRRGSGGDPNPALEAVIALSQAPKSKAGGEVWSGVAKVPLDQLIQVGRNLANLRKDHRNDLRKAATNLIDRYIKEVPEDRPHAEPIVRRTMEPISGGPAGATPSGVAGPRPTSRLTVAVEAAPTPALTRPAGVRPSAEAALHWALSAAPQAAGEIFDLAGRFRGLDNLLANIDLVAGTLVEIGPGGGSAQPDPDWTDDLVDGFEESMRVEPIGRLHLERIDMTPARIMRGELMHSIALAPMETVQVIHREWSSRTTEFEKVVSEEFEQSTEEGVTENTDLSSATESQSKHSRALNVEASGSASYGFGSASMTVGYTTSSDDETAKRDSRNHAVSVTRKASARTRQEHKVTFTVKEEAGVEDQSIRTITNKSETDPMRIDYHQLMRQWQVDLYRYGIRLTYDLVVPAPGLDLLAQMDRLRALDGTLNAPFVFPLGPSQITAASLPQLIARYGGNVEPPPVPAENLFAQQILEPGDDDTVRFYTLDFEIPPGYQVKKAHCEAFVQMDDGGFFEVVLDTVPGVEQPHGAVNPVRGYISGLQHLIKARGRVAIVMYSYRLNSGHVQATLELEPTVESMSAWQQRTWAALRESAYSNWEAAREQAQAERDRVSKEIAKWDPLSLRRLEREEVMKTVLKWIFGPDFDLMGDKVQQLYQSGSDLAQIEPSNLTPEDWARVMGAGEFIKFLQTSIEWENVITFPYPYFWDHPKNHAAKLFLHHPDSMYRTFLRAGAIRVVLTVRPGFEESFTRLFEGGAFEAELEGNPYLTIAQEIRSYADTKYPGVPSAEVPGSEPSEDADRGVKIASWYEYTPVSGLDITVNAALEDIA